MTRYDKLLSKSVVIRREMDQFPREARVKDVLKTIFLSKVVFSGGKKEIRFLSGVQRGGRYNAFSWWKTS